MLKDEIRKLIDEGQGKIERFNAIIQQIKESKTYSNEFKISENASYQNKIIETVQEYSQRIIQLFDDEINRINSINFYEDKYPEETANILKMIELSKINMNEKEIKYLLGTYKANNIITRALIAVASEKDINLGNDFIPRTENIERWKEDTIKALDYSKLDLSTFNSEVLLNMMNI